MSDTPLGEVLRERRRIEGRSLDSIVAPGLSKGALSNYERGAALPAEELLPKLAARYGLEEEVVIEAFRRSLPRPTEEPIADGPQRLRQELAAGDQVFFVTQRSVLPSRPQVIGLILELAARAIPLTYIAYVPKDHVFEPAARRWAGNLRESARLLWQAAADQGMTDAVRNVNYVLFRAPDENDWCFLRAHGSLVYRKARQGLQESSLWAQVEAPDGRLWWCPESYVLLSDLNYWLVHECGLLDEDSRLREIESDRLSVCTIRDFIGVD